MKYADLHIHSSYSDGKFTPEEIVKLARDRGVKYISITDHDSIDSQYIIKENFEDIKLISGIELSTEIWDLEIHILGYFIDVGNNFFLDRISRLKEARANRARVICERLKKEGIIIDIENLIQNNPTIGRAHIAHEIVRNGYEDNFKLAFNKYLIKGKKTYEKGNKLNYKEALDLINKAGGVAILAHPGKIYRWIDVDNIIKELKCYGLEGIEVYHPSHTDKQMNFLYNLSKKYKLLITGGTDFHDFSMENIKIGSQGINEILLNKLINSR